MSMGRPILLHRQQHWQGQMLRSQDLCDQVATAAQLRWWHNRSRLHNAFGIASGLDVHANDGTDLCAGYPDRFYEGETSIIVCPGVAYDCFGRELIVKRPCYVPLPLDDMARANQTLLVRYREDRECPRRVDTPMVCLSGQPSRSVEWVELAWQDSGEVEIRDGVPLVEVTQSEDGSLQENRSLRRYARPHARPRFGSGSTIPGNTAWEIWRSRTCFGDTFVGIQVQVDTSAAGFMGIPSYFAWLQAPLWDPKESHLCLVPFEQVGKVSATGFTFHAWLPNLALKGGRKGAEMEQDHPYRVLAFAMGKGLYVSWLGIELQFEALKDEVNDGSSVRTFWC